MTNKIKLDIRDICSYHSSILTLLFFLGSDTTYSDWCVLKFLDVQGSSRLLWNVGIYQTTRRHPKENNVNITRKWKQHRWQNTHRLNRTSNFTQMKHNKIIKLINSKLISSYWNNNNNAPANKVYTLNVMLTTRWATYM